MPNPLVKRWLVTAMLLQGIFILPCVGQVRLPNSYGQYYQPKIPSYAGTGVSNSSRYLYDKYFYHRTTVSPYINLGRPGSDFAYQAYVRPELQRREASATATRAYVQQRKLEGRVGETRAIMKPNMPSQATSSAYYNHWYGGWNKR